MPNWSFCEYHIQGTEAVLIVHKKESEPATSMNPGQRDVLKVVSNTPDRILLANVKDGETGFDVIYPRDGDAFSFFSSNYLSKFPTSPTSNLAKMYSLTCSEIR